MIARKIPAMARLMRKDTDTAKTSITGPRPAI